MKLTFRRNKKINAPARKALRYLWDLKNMPRYEVKVGQIKLEPESNRRGEYEVRGKFLGVPWSGHFDYQLNSSGFKSKGLKLPFGVKVMGGFSVKALNKKSCLINHYEKYDLPLPFLPFYPVIKPFIRYSLWKELNQIEFDLLRSTARQQ